MTLEVISIATSPASRTRSSSAQASSGACIGTIPMPSSRLGSAWVSSAMNALTRRHSSRPSSPGRLKSSSGGMGETTSASTPERSCSSRRRCAE